MYLLYFCSASFLGILCQPLPSAVFASSLFIGKKWLHQESVFPSIFLFKLAQIEAFISRNIWKIKRNASEYPKKITIAIQIHGFVYGMGEKFKYIHRYQDIWPGNMYLLLAAFLSSLHHPPSFSVANLQLNLPRPSMLVAKITAIESLPEYRRNHKSPLSRTIEGNFRFIHSLCDDDSLCGPNVARLAQTPKTKGWQGIETFTLSSLIQSNLARASAEYQCHSI